MPTMKRGPEFPTDGPTKRAFDLVDGKCPVCGTPVETEVDGVRMRFMPHDDPDWCSAAAVSNARMLRRLIDQANEDLALVKHREAFYRQAFAVSLRELARIVGAAPDEYREILERKVREEMDRAKERAEVAAVMLARDGMVVEPLERLSR